MAGTDDMLTFAVLALLEILGVSSGITQAISLEPSQELSSLPPIQHEGKIADNPTSTDILHYRRNVVSSVPEVIEEQGEEIKAVHSLFGTTRKRSLPLAGEKKESNTFPRPPMGMKAPRVSEYSLKNQPITQDEGKLSRYVRSADLDLKKNSSRENKRPGSLFLYAGKQPTTEHGDKDERAVSLFASSESVAGTKLGGFIIDILLTTGHMDIHLVTNGDIVEGLDTVAFMCNQRYIQIEIWVDVYYFLTHLGPTEGYLSTDQFLVYGTSYDILTIITQRRTVMDVINVRLTTWYYVVMDNELANQEIADALEEGSISLLMRPSLFREDDWIAYTLVSPGGGSKYFRAVGRWTEQGGLEVRRDLFPPISLDLRGRNLLIGVINKPRVLEFRDEQGRWTDLRGYSAAILKELQQVLNFTVSLREFEFWGSPDANGHWDGVIGALFDKEIDFSPMDFTPTKESREVIDFTEWVGEDPVVIVSAAPQPEIRPFLLLEIYQPWVYLSLIATLFVCAFVMWALTRANAILLVGVYAPSKVQKLSKVLLSASKTIVAQCLKDTPNELSVRVFLIMVWFMSLIIDTVYQGHITAFIAMPRYTPAIDNHEELAQNNSVIPVTEEFSTTQTLIMESQRESFMALASRLELYDASFLDSEEFYHGISVGKWAFVDSYSSTYGRALNFENRISRCKFYVSRDSVTGGLDAWPFPRNSPVHSQISRSLKWLRYYGILEKIKSRYYVSTCDRSRGDGVKKMDITMMQSSFYVAGIGWSLAGTVFLLELILYRLIRM